MQGTKSPTKDAFLRIHHIDGKFNQLFSTPLLIASFLVSLLCVLLPYSGRIALAFIINFLFNRPKIYFHYFSHFFSVLISVPVFLFCYFIFFAPYAFIWRLKRNLFTTTQEEKLPPLSWESLFFMS